MVEGRIQKDIIIYIYKSVPAKAIRRFMAP